MSLSDWSVLSYKMTRSECFEVLEGPEGSAKPD